MLSKFSWWGANAPLHPLATDEQNVLVYKSVFHEIFFSRLKNSAEEICEILLSKGYVLSAVRYARGRGIESVPAQKFLEASKCNNEDFYTVYTFLKERNLLPRGCAEYTKHFQTLFGNGNE